MGFKILTSELLLEFTLKVNESPLNKLDRTPDNNYLIRQKDTDLYITISSKETNSSIILMPKQNSNAQQWKIVEQDPWL